MNITDEARAFSDGVLAGLVATAREMLESGDCDEYTSALLREQIERIERTRRNPPAVVIRLCERTRNATGCDDHRDEPTCSCEALGRSMPSMGPGRPLTRTEHP